MPIPDHPSGPAGRRDDADEPATFPRESPEPPEPPEPFEFADPEPTPRGLASCPKCGLLQHGDAAICTRCGAAVAGASSSAQRKAALEKSKPCRNCGYEMRGLPHARCPECGTGNPVGRRRDLELDAEVESRRRMRIALTIGGVCAGVCLLIAVFGAGWRGPIAFAIFTIIELPIAVGMTFLLNQFAIEIDDTWPLTTARLFAAQMITSVALLVMAIVCLPSVLLSVIVLMIALSYLLDLEPTEAFILGAALAGVRIVISLVFVFGF